MELETKSVKEKKRDLTSFEIGDLRGPWEAYCKSNNVTSGQALCQVIQKLTGADPSKIPKSARLTTSKPSRPQRLFKTSEGGKEGRSRLYLSLTTSEREAVEARAKADGFEKGSAWTIALVRARLTDEPQFGTREIDILGESNHQLLAIGRNLNQIAHALNAARGQSVNAHDIELIDELAKAVKRHVRKVGDALRASINRWTLE